MPNTTTGVDRADKATAIANLQNELARFDDLCEQLVSLNLSFDEIRRLPIGADLVSVILAKQQASDAEVPAVRRPTVDDFELWFDMLADLADLAVQQNEQRMGNLTWVIGQLAEKFKGDVQSLRGEVHHD